MAKLFGIDIAKLVNSEIVKAGNVRTGVLTKAVAGTRTPGDETAGTNPSETEHTFNGFVEDRVKRREGSLSEEGKTLVSILGASMVPFAIPEVNDEALIDGVTYVLARLRSRDPASALYEFEAGAQ